MNSISPAFAALAAKISTPVIETRSLSLTADQWRHLEIEVARDLLNAEQNVRDCDLCLDARGADLAEEDVEFFQAICDALEGPR